ncbi:ABC transporter ATP-binding protein [Eisenbergiella porci]|uniref:ABC transporter ATP-binding protein n=1 Tax=Eisenbergiella porci TaxID=2652274 RepID=UPI002A804B9B|nr:ABC transporter ATP-binding protein [Eisenbergiella porci]
MEPLLEVSGLEKRLGTLHLNQISFRVEPGHIAGLVGVNGAGKTTLLHTILNLYDKNGGQVTVCGYDMDTQEREAKDRLGLVLDEMMYEKGLPGLGNARLYGRLYHHFNESLFLELCERFELPPNRKLGLLSTGFKMRFQFAFALSQNARLFLMDEPASGLDPLFRKNLIHCMQDIVEGGTRSILFSTHITEDLDGTASQILWLHDGEMDVLENGAGAEIEALLTGKFRIRDLLEKYGETV